MAARIPIPEYQAKSTPNFVPGAPRTPDTRQVSIGPALEHAGDVLQAHALKFKADTDETAVNDAYATQFGPALRELRGSYYALQGKNAVDQRPEFEKKMLELQQQTRDALKSPDQQKMFDGMARKRVEGELDSMAVHAATERKSWMAQTHEAVLSNLATDAADKAGDEQAFAGALRSGLFEVERYGTSSGRSADWMRAQGEKFVSTAWVQRVERLALSDPEAAQKLYTAHQSEVAAASRPVLEARVKSLVMPVQAKRLADEATQSLDADTSKDVRATMGDTLKAAAKRADELYPNNPVFAAAVENEVKAKLSTVAQAQAGLEGQAAQVLLKRAAIDAKPQTIEALLADPEAKKAWSVASAQSQLGILGQLRHNQHEAENGGQAMKTNAKVFADLSDRIGLPDDDPRKIRSANELTPYLARGLAPAGFNFLQQRLDQLRTDSGQRFDKTREDFFKSVHKQFDTSTLVKDDPMGGEDFFKFKAYAADKEAQFRKEGKDPYALFNPGSPDYLGKQMAPFMRSEGQKMNDYMARLRSSSATAPKALPPEQQRKAGESIDDYRKRQGLK